MEKQIKRLFTTVCIGSVAELVRLIDQNVNLDASDEHGNRAIHYAAKGNQAQKLQILLDNGAYINAVNNELQTALHVAIKKGNENCIAVLLNGRMNVNQFNKDGYNELMVAVNEENMDNDKKNRIIEQLLNYSKINLREISKNKLKQTALHYAAKNGNEFAVSKLLGKDTYLNYIRNAYDNLAIHIAAANGHCDVIKEMLKLQPTLDINVKGHNSLTPLQVAVLNMKYSVVEFFIELNADCNIADADGNTALHAAVKLYNACCIKKSMRIISCQTKIDHGNHIKKLRESLFITHHNNCYNFALIAFLIKNGNATINATNNVGESATSLVGKKSKVLKLMN
ncbi:E3 ubiquitin-protein ligase MIB2-like protein [Leptotrombidium deliense]|uniref:Alpha-latrotoxin n=1 Tax=Leptotrombidium deliense TaxID=299467 RepID=A0A443S1P5_9ACAR|nr:E3 ubiquitin-protein ligase MIB2-like protein [Leptotrombidium deliense]